MIFSEVHLQSFGIDELKKYDSKKIVVLVIFLNVNTLYLLCVAFVVYTHFNTKFEPLQNCKYNFDALIFNSIAIYSSSVYL